MTPRSVEEWARTRTCKRCYLGEFCADCMVAYAAEQVAQARVEEREACAVLAESAEELDGPIPADLLTQIQSVGIEESMRAAVRATKKEIATAIRAGRNKDE